MTFVLQILFNNFVIFYNGFIETGLRLVDELYVTSFIGNLRRLIIEINKYFNYSLIGTITHLHNIVLMCIL